MGKRIGESYDLEASDTNASIKVLEKGEGDNFTRTYSIHMDIETCFLAQEDYTLITERECRRLFSEIINHFKLPLSVAEELTTRYLKNNKSDYTSLTSSTSGNTEFFHVTTLYDLRFFEEFIKRCCKVKHSYRRSTLIPNLNSRAVFFMYKDQAKQLDKLCAMEDYNWKKTLGEIRREKNYYIIKD
jgi:hypothetical protein